MLLAMGLINVTSEVLEGPKQFDSIFCNKDCKNYFICYLCYSSRTTQCFNETTEAVWFLLITDP